MAAERAETLSVSIKVDTGMSRIGFPAGEEAADAACRIASLPGLKIHGMFTHFACADEPSSDMTRKQFERFLRAEEALRAAEALCATAGAKFYPKAEFERLWRDLLVCQFHDIIPGASIARVYKECGEMVRNVARDALALADKAGRSLLKKDAGAVTFFNPSSTDFEDVVALPKGWTGRFLFIYKACLFFTSFIGNDTTIRQLYNRNIRIGKFFCLLNMVPIKLFCLS